MLRTNTLNLYSTFQIVLVLGFLASTSCKKKEETPAPSVQISSSTAGSDKIIGNAKTLDVVTINLTASATEGLKELSVFKVNGSMETVVPGYPKTSGFDSDKTHLWVFTYTVTETSGEVILKFLVADKVGKTAGVTYKIVIAPIAAPTMQMVSNSISPNLTTGSVERGSPISFNLLAKAPKGIKSVTASKSVAGTETTLDGYPKTTGFTTDSTFVWTVNYVAADLASQVVLTFKVENQAGTIQSLNYTLTLTDAVPPFSYSAKLLGAQNNAAASFFSPTTGQVYFSNQFPDFVANKVDISFAQTGSGFTVPKFISLSERGNEGLASVTSIDRETTFSLLSTTQMDAGKFSALTNVQVKALTVSGSGVMPVTLNRFYAFQNEEGKKGVIKVTALDEGSGTNGSVVFDLKFEN